MPDAVIVDAVRTPIGERRGSLAEIHRADLSAHVLRALVERTGVDPELVDDVIWGCVGQLGEQGAQIGRNAALAAGFPETVPGVTINRACGSSQQSVDLVDPLGGAIAVGHPLGASGAILLTRMLNHMRDRGIRYGLRTMCEGGGTANATIVELLD
jgi:acetyl-CoA acyltransferase